MFLMSTLIVISANSIHLDRSWFRTNKSFCCSMVRCRLSIIHQKKRYISRLVPNAKKGEDPQKKRPWWKMLFLDDDYSGWFSTEEADLIEEAHSEDENDDESAIEDTKFDTWRRRAEALAELRNAQEEARDADNREWEDWLESDSLQNADGSSWEQDLNDNVDVKRFDSEDESDMFPEKRLVQSIKDLVLRRYDDEFLFEDKVFNYASTNSAKFVAFLILIPWAVDFVVHDFVLMPFLDRYVKTVPLAAEFLDVRKSQKLQMVKALNLEKARLRFEVEIGKAPPLSDDEVWLELKHRAIEMRDEWRLENRNAFANIWSDIVYGITLFLLVYFNQNRVALLKFTGYKLINNVSETGKAFLIILITDIFLGYHSASGWEALLEAILERYGLEVDQAAITIFICFFPVVIDACVKLWLFKFLPRVSPNVTNIFREMKRH